MRRAFAISLLALTSAPAFADPAPPKSWEAFDALDANHDGVLSLDELQAAGETWVSRFAELDTDKSGGLSWMEINPHKRANSTLQGPEYEDDDGD